ncbi:carbon catabolite repressor protein 4 homolog 3-like isoform X2 [Tasmannia lanceolata]|uniref:carbon catabolite repressor protein 4 homolog 3-like isoform X2 n=1 Tax=Tasmannia lanceolata TaxID=3420 RepID=UPI00406440A3
MGWCLCIAQAPLPTLTHQSLERYPLSKPITSSCFVDYPTHLAHLSKSIPSCCIDYPTHTPPYTKRAWYNPERQRKFNQPEIFRRWIETDSPSPSISQERVRVVSYNILGDDNASKHSDLYSHIPSDFMNWETRRKLICRELSGLNPDIVCLQEVDRYDDLLSSMRNKGYIGSFKRRTGEAMDGCAIFWKENLFCLLEGESIEFKGFGLRDNVAQLFVFEMNKGDSRRLLVGNIHVLFNPNRGDIKLGQIRLLLSKAHTLSKKWGSIPIVLVGDFNSTPQSAIYEFLSSSKLNITLHDKRHLSGQSSCRPAQFVGMPRQMWKPYIFRDRFSTCTWTDEEVKIASGNSECTKLEHPLKLYSSYASVKGNTRTRGFQGEPLATTYHSNFIGTVDYLWYSDALSPMKVLDTVSIDVLRKSGGLPSKRLGSDHLALVCEFAFIQERREGEEQSNAADTKTARKEEDADIGEADQ